MRNHDESNDLKSFAKIGSVRANDKTLRASKSTHIGIKMWGKIDYLTHYCGWIFIYDNDAKGNSFKSKDDNEDKKPRKKSKEHKLTNKKR